MPSLFTIRLAFHDGFSDILQQNYERFHRERRRDFQTGLKLPVFFGENLDALWDCLTGFIGYPCEIRLSGLSPLHKQRRQELQDILDLLAEAEEKYPDEYHIVYVD